MPDHSLPSIDEGYLLTALTDLLNIPSPTGYTQIAMEWVKGALLSFPTLRPKETRKGIVVATWPGVRSDTPRALTAHVDTLGAVVKEIKANGRLKLSRIGGVVWNTVEGEGCTVITHGGGQLRGAILLDKASTHVHGRKVGEIKRDEENMEVRLDVRTTSAEETRRFGVEVGDFVAFDTRLEVNSGFVRGRHLDDKAGVACMLAAIQALHLAGLQPAQTSLFHFSNYEEVGHGAATGIPGEVAELVVVDMAAVGQGQNSDEFHATLCVKDSGGPYHFGLNRQLRQLAEDYKIAYKVDVYPFYRSDGEAFWHTGGDVSVALIGPGVDASHNYERTHMDALIATTQWILAYLLSD